MFFSLQTHTVKQSFALLRLKRNLWFENELWLLRLQITSNREVIDVVASRKGLMNKSGRGFVSQYSK